MTIASSVATHPGTVRPRNEDSVVNRLDLGLFAVADGAGGHGAGDVASQAVAAALEAIPPGLSAAEVLAQARLRIAAAHADLQTQAAAAGEGRIIATTVVLLLVRGEHFACLWAGDSRAYLLRAGRLSRVTRDHSLVQELVDAGTLTEAEAEAHPQANVILRAVGGIGELLLDKVSGRLLTGDRVLLCSDGLFKAVAEDAIAAVLAGGGDADALIHAALVERARDNVSALIVDVAA